MEAQPDSGAKKNAHFGDKRNPKKNAHFEDKLRQNLTKKKHAHFEDKLFQGQKAVFFPGEGVFPAGGAKKTHILTTNKNTHILKTLWNPPMTGMGL